MKNRFMVWTKEPYGEWVKALEKPLSRSAAAAHKLAIDAGPRPLKTALLPAGDAPPKQE
jgi:hypothetical protein